MALCFWRYWEICDHIQYKPHQVCGVVVVNIAICINIGILYLNICQCNEFCEILVQVNGISQIYNAICVNITIRNISVINCSGFCDF